MKKGCTKCMTTQWRQFWEKIGAIYSYFLRKNNIFFFNLRKLRIQRFKRITIRSWNEGDMTNRSIVTQGACYYGIAYESNSFLLSGLNFGLLLLGSFWWKLGLLGFHFSLTLFKLECAWLENFILKKRKVGKRIKSFLTFF